LRATARVDVPLPKKKNSDEDDVRFNNALVSKYNWRLVGEESVNGRESYFLTFEPKSKDLPIHNMPDRLLNKLAGKMWIDKQDFEITRADAHLTDNASMLGGLAGTMRRTDLLFEQTRLDDGAWLQSKCRFTSTDELS